MPFAAALLAGLLLLATAVPASATMFGVITGLCIPPADVAINMSGPANTPDDPLPGGANCEALCKKWVSACKGAVSIAQSCFSRAITKVANLHNAACDENTDPVVKKLCRSSVAGDKNDAKRRLGLSVEDGIDQCEGTGLLVCLLNCD